MKIRSLLIIAVILTQIPVVYADEEYHNFLTLESPEPDSRAEFGFFAIDYNETHVFVGESRAKVDGVYQSGKVHVFEWDGNFKASLQAPVPQTGARFGMSVVVKENKIFVGEYLSERDGRGDVGQVHIFNSDGSHITTIISPEPLSAGRFGRSLALIEDTLVVSEIYTRGRTGAVHLFDLDGKHLSTFQSPQPEAAARFGYSIATSENLIVIGEHHADVEDKADAGKVHVFDVNGEYLSTLQSPEPKEFGNFGESVAVDEDVIVVGEGSEDSLDKAGRVHVFDLNGNFLATITSPMPEAEALFGSEGGVATFQDMIIIGEYGADGESNDEGRAYVFDKEGNLLETLRAPEPSENARYGAYVYASGELFAVYELGTVKGEYGAGRVYFYQEKAPVEIQEPVEETTPVAEEEPETEDTGGWIPGFPVIALALGLLYTIVFLTQRKR